MNCRPFGENSFGDPSWNQTKRVGPLSGTSIFQWIHQQMEGSRRSSSTDRIMQALSLLPFVPPTSCWVGRAQPTGVQQGPPLPVRCGSQLRATSRMVEAAEVKTVSDDGGDPGRGRR